MKALISAIASIIFASFFVLPAKLVFLLFGLDWEFENVLFVLVVGGLIVSMLIDHDQRFEDPLRSFIDEPSHYLDVMAWLMQYPYLNENRQCSTGYVNAGAPADWTNRRIWRCTTKMNCVKK